MQRGPSWLTLLLATLALHPSAGPLNAQKTDPYALAPCDDTHYGGDGEQYRELRMEGLPASAVTLTIDGGENGGAIVTGWDRDSIDVRACVHARANTAAAARELSGRIRLDLSDQRLAAVGPEPRRDEAWAVVFHVRVPRRSNLRLSAHNGPVGVENVVGHLDLRTQNGPISIQETGGQVVARAQNGPLHVVLGGTSWEGAGLDAETQNGPIHLEIPEGYDARLETGTVHGPMDIEFPLTVTLEGGRPNRFTTTLGSGGTPLRVVTTNGPVSIERR